MYKILISGVIAVLVLSCSTKRSKQINICRESLSMKQYYPNSMLMDKQLQICFAELIDESYNILKEIEKRKETKIHDRIKNSINQSSQSIEFTTEQVNWASSLLKENGMPTIDSVTVKSQFPIYQIFNSPETYISFVFPFVNSEIGCNDEIKISYSLNIQGNTYSIKLWRISFLEAEDHKQLLDLLNNGF